MTDKAIRHLTTAAVLLVAALAATVSYVHIRDLAVTHGGDKLTSALLPLLIDGTVAAMSCVMLRAARLENVSTPWLARVMLAVSVGATLAANTAYGAAYGISGALLWTLPAVMFVGCVEVSVAMVRRTRPIAAKQEGKCATSSPLPDSGFSASSPLPGGTGAAEPVKREPVRVRAVTVTGLTARQEAAMLDRSLSTIQRWRRDGSIGERLAAVNGNGKAHG